MLRREIRVFVFIATFILLLVLLYQLNFPASSHRQHDLVAVQEFSDYAQGRNLKSYWEEKAASRYYSEPLSRRVIENVEQFLFFVGYARSGHSIIASMLDAHPNVVIAHEYALFTKWESEPAKHKNKTWLFNALYDNSRFNIYQGLRTKHALKKGYTLAIPGSWQGRYDTSTGISVIGDKSGGMTAQVFRKNRKLFRSLYQELRNTVQMPIHVIHVVRNPYDNIATMLLYNEHQKFKVNETRKYDDKEALESQIISYFHQVRSVVEMINEVGLKVIEIHIKEFIANPKATLRNLCLALQIDCSEAYLHMCSSKAFTSESRSRSLVKWTPSLIDMVYQNIQKYKHLQRYSFYS